MNREEWYKHYRASRIERKKNWKLGPSTTTLNEMFKEHYGHILYSKDRVKYDLIEKYEDQISYRLKQEKKELRKKAKVQGDNMWKELAFAPNPLLKLIPRDNHIEYKTYTLGDEFKE